MTGSSEWMEKIPRAKYTWVKPKPVDGCQYSMWPSQAFERNAIRFNDPENDWTFVNSIVD